MKVAGIATYDDGGSLLHFFLCRAHANLIRSYPSGCVSGGSFLEKFLLYTRCSDGKIWLWERLLNAP